MATILSHPAIPMALGLALGTKQISSRLLCAGIVCSILPDLDVILFQFGVRYASQFGHRGFTHSLFFAFMMGVLFATLAGRLKTTPLKAFLFTAFATASHGLLDALTTGGLGVAFLWPFQQDRFFLPYRLIPVSPIGLSSFMTERGWMVLKAEMLTIWLPCTFFVAFTQFLRLRKYEA
jgi:inner membrane protein